MKTEKRSKNSARQMILVFCSCVLIVLVLAGCESGSLSDVKPTPAPISFIPLQLDIPSKALNAPITGNVPDSQPLHIGVTLKVDQQVLDQMSKNGIAKSGDTTNASNIAKKLGISDADYQRFKQFFGVSGADLHLSQTRTSMTIDIKASSLAQLLQTKFVQHKLDDRTFYTPDPQHMPKIPGVLANYILAVTGLDNYSLPPRHQLRIPSQQAQQSAASKQASINCNPRLNALNWRQLAHTYGYDQLWQKGQHGENMTINLVEIDATNLDDLHAYFACTGFKGTLDFVTVDGAYPKPTKTDAETTLDIEMIAGLAPAAHIKDYQTDVSKLTTYGDFWGRFNDSLQHILDDNASSPSLASAVSISLGGSEGTLTGEVAKATSQRIQLLTLAEHMTVYAASGDCGAFTNGVIGSLSTSYPATDPLAVSVGGTTILPTHQEPGGRYREISWTGVPTSVTCQNDWGSGGGVSKLFKKPTWQQAPGVNNRYSNGHRQVPDIAALADIVPIFLEGKWILVGGTSAATPIWAAGMALVNQGLLATKGLYVYGPDTFYFVQAHGGNLKPYYDEVEGTNLYYFAGPGWDYTTGLGSPNLSAFYQTVYNNATV